MSSRHSKALPEMLSPNRTKPSTCIMNSLIRLNFQTRQIVIVTETLVLARLWNIFFVFSFEFFPCWERRGTDFKFFFCAKVFCFFGLMLKRWNLKLGISWSSFVWTFSIVFTMLECTDLVKGIKNVKLFVVSNLKPK